MPLSTERDDSGLSARLDALGALWLAVTLALFVVIRPGWELPGRIPREYVLILGAAALAGLRLARGRLSPLTGWPARLALVFVLGGACGLLAVPAAARLDVLWALAPLTALWGIGLFAARSVGAPPGRATADRGVTLGATIGVALAGALALAQSYAGLDLLPQAKQPAATFMQRNVLAQTLVVALPVTLAYALGTRSRLWRALAFLAGGLGAAALVATRTRGAWIAFVCALLLALGIALARRVRWRRGVAGGLAFVACAATLAVVVEPPVERRLPSVARSIELLGLSGESSVSTRRAFAANSLEMIAASPLVGHGAGRFPADYPLFHDAARPTPGFGLTKRPDHAHNELLHAGAELGLPAALALAAFLALALARALRRAVRDPRPGVALWHGAMASALAGVLVHAQVSFPLRSPASAFLAFALAGMAWRPDTESPRRTARSRALSCELLLLVLLLPAVALIPYDASRQDSLERALDAWSSGDAAGAARLAESPSAHPFRARTRGLATMLRFETDRSAHRTLPALERALAADPYNLNLLLATGARRLKAERPRDALTAFRHALRIDDALGRAWLGVAMAEATLGDRAAAAAACRRALAEQPEPPGAAAFCVGNGLVPRGRPADAR